MLEYKERQIFSLQNQSDVTFVSKTVSFVFSFRFLSLLLPNAGFSTLAFPQSHLMDASSFKNSTFSFHLGVTESTLCLFFFSSFLHLQNHWNHWTSKLLDMHIIMQTESGCNNTTRSVVERTSTHLTAGRRLTKMRCGKEQIASQAKKVSLWVSVCVYDRRSTYVAINNTSKISGCPTARNGKLLSAFFSPTVLTSEEVISLGMSCCDGTDKWQFKRDYRSPFNRCKWLIIK